MKILAIKGKNLASLEGEFEIDFTSEPLKSAGIFAITGQTGAGKSTILDALCLALFDNAPRLNKAEPIKKDDLESLTDKISPQDCRNILRRGSSEGYAEVDFIALNGDKYRSRWTVRRARGKSDGSLQTTAMKLENLSTNTEEQGTKSNLLSRIEELTGLTFDQFTRAVLLAQGEFANFLKANKNEKAELLEKLTGTEVYSKISILIYDNFLSSKNALNLIQQRIKDIKLLSDEELETLNSEKKTSEKELMPLKREISVVEKKLEWFKQEQQLEEEESKAETNLKSIQEKIIEAIPRREYLKLVDVAQEIRDSYVQLNNKEIETDNLLKELQEKQEELKAISEKRTVVEETFKSAKSTLDKTEEQYNLLKPDLGKAKKLDIEIASLNRQLNEVEKEVKNISVKKEQHENNISKLKDQEEELKQKKNQIENWFSDNEHYKPIIPKIDYIYSLIERCSSVKKQETTIHQSLESSKALLKTYDEQLEQYLNEAERLNNLLPTEVLNLRAKLKDGEPCPVCGSIHHPLNEQTEQQDRFNDETLEKQKEQIAKEIIATKEIIDNTKTGITEFETHIKNFHTQYEKAFGELNELLVSISEWKTLFDNGTLPDDLKNIVSKWDKNNESIIVYDKKQGELIIKLEAECKNLESTCLQLNEKNEKYKSINISLNDHVEKRKLLLDNKTVEEVESHYTKLKQQNSKTVEEVRNKKEKITSDIATLEGVIAQLRTNQELNKNEIVKLREEVDVWLNVQNETISLELLKELTSKLQDWINQERKFLNDIDNRELVSKTRLEENRKQLKSHNASENKPTDEETNETLSVRLKEATETYEILTQHLTEIGVKLLNHQNCKNQIATFEKDLNEKTELYENWAKLNDLLGSASGNKFKTIAQGYTLDVLLSYANKHLEELTKRYKLEKITGTLALQVIDNDMLGEIRTVHSLSGGESFLISLALALGLSSLSSNRMKIESLFIDEGFGALDIDTLSIAMDALDNLQTQGRKIGVISHVEEMKERITTQIQVVKSANGRSNIRIIN